MNKPNTEAQDVWESPDGKLCVQKRGHDFFALIGTKVIGSRKTIEGAIDMLTTVNTRRERTMRMLAGR